MQFTGLSYLGKFVQARKGKPLYTHSYAWTCVNFLSRLYLGCDKFQIRNTLTNPLKGLSFQTLFDAAADAMLLVDSNGLVIEANNSALQMLEHTETTLCGLAVEALMPERFRGHHHQYRDTFFKSPEKRSMGNGRDLFALSGRGKELAVDIGLSPIKIQDQNYVLITFYPADKRREIEQALRASEERLRLAKQVAGLGVFDLNPRQDIVHFDENMHTIWGVSANELMDSAHLVAAIHPEDRATGQAALEAASNPAGSGEYNVEYRVINKTDGIVRWASAVGKMQFENGQPTRLIGVIRDITEHKAFEKTLQVQRAETESVFKQQVAARTASAIAHELNQPLAAISAYSEVALHAMNDATSNPDKLKRALQGCVAQAQRAGTSLHELMAFLQEGELITEPFDLNEIVKLALEVAKGDGYKEFQPVLKLEKNIPAVLANRIQVQKVLVNLLRNGVEAMRGAGAGTGEATSAITITVRTNTETNMGHVTVQDSGPGISKDVVKRIFEPFFTSKPTGIGMGLAISRALIEANGGQLWLEPDTKTGASFHFTLPFAP
jgi:two-component system, LuxR family, sensor kinase FixL